MLTHRRTNPIFSLKLQDGHDQNDQNDDRQNEGHVAAQPFGEFQALARVHLAVEIVPAPTVPGDTEEHIEQTSDGQQQVGNGEIFQIHEVFAEDQDITPNVQAEDTG